MTARGSNARLVGRLILAVVLMFGFGFALVPLYDVFCRVTGLNGKVYNTGIPAQVADVQSQRQVKVQLVAVNNEQMPWQFKPQERQMTVHPGEQRLTAYHAFNPTGRDMVAQAVPSVSPAAAAEYLHKINCFCFDRQPLNAGSAQEMPLVFMIDPELPEHIHTVTLSYTLFDITPDALAQVEEATP